MMTTTTAWTIAETVIDVVDVQRNGAPQLRCPPLAEVNEKRARFFPFRKEAGGAICAGAPGHWSVVPNRFCSSNSAAHR